MRDAMASCNTPSDGQLQRMMARTSSKDLPTFSGNAEEWPTFSTMLRTTTEQCCFSNVENMIRLQKALKGRARDFVLPLLTVPEGNTPQVIRTVEKRFGRPDVVVQTLIEQTKSFSGLKDGELKLLLDFSNAVCFQPRGDDEADVV